MKQIKIATFNINKEEMDFPNRIFKLENHITHNSFDILCLQEDYKSNTFSSSDEVNKNINFYKYTLGTREKRRKGILSSSNLTILSSFKASFVESIYFDEIKNEQRAALFVCYKIEDKSILVVNTHLCHLEETNRLVQIKGILNKINSYEEIDEVIICGDLNSKPNSKVIKLLKENGFTFNNNEFTALRKEIIDYILYKNLKCLESKIILKEFSDHFCLYNQLEL